MQIDDSPPDAAFLVSRKVKVKLTGDGTNIGKHLHVVNFAFTIHEEEEKAHSAAGNHCVAIFKATENYDDMKLCLQDIVKDIVTDDICWWQCTIVSDLFMLLYSY